MEYINKYGLKIKLLNENLVEQDVEAIVNAANSGLWHGNGVCDAVFEKAGAKELEKECEAIIRKVKKVNTGTAAITSGYNMSKYIIHAVGPVYRDPSSAPFLRNAYINSLKLADENNIKTIAFPSISTGIYGYPLDEASEVAIKALLEYNPKTLKEVRMCFLDTHSMSYYVNALKELTK